MFLSMSGGGGLPPTPAPPSRGGLRPPPPPPPNPPYPDRADNSLSRQLFMASFGDPGDLSASGGGFGCGKSNGKATTATTEKATPGSR